MQTWIIEESHWKKTVQEKVGGNTVGKMLHEEKLQLHAKRQEHPR